MRGTRRTVSHPSSGAEPGQVGTQGPGLLEGRVGWRDGAEAWAGMRWVLSFQGGWGAQARSSFHSAQGGGRSVRQEREHQTGDGEPGRPTRPVSPVIPIPLGSQPGSSSSCLSLPWDPQQPCSAERGGGVPRPPSLAMYPSTLQQCQGSAGLLSTCNGGIFPLQGAPQAPSPPP